MVAGWKAEELLLFGRIQLADLPLSQEDLLDFVPSLHRRERRRSRHLVAGGIRFQLEAVSRQPPRVKRLRIDGADFHRRIIRLAVDLPGAQDHAGIKETERGGIEKEDAARLRPGEIEAERFDGLLPLVIEDRHLDLDACRTRHRRIERRGVRHLGSCSHVTPARGTADLTSSLPGCAGTRLPQRPKPSPARLCC